MVQASEDDRYGCGPLAMLTPNSLDDLKYDACSRAEDHLDKFFPKTSYVYQYQSTLLSRPSGKGLA